MNNTNYFVNPGFFLHAFAAMTANGFAANLSFEEKKLSFFTVWLEFFHLV